MLRRTLLRVPRPVCASVPSRSYLVERQDPADHHTLKVRKFVLDFKRDLKENAGMIVLQQMQFATPAEKKFNEQIRNNNTKIYNR